MFEFGTVVWIFGQIIETFSGKKKSQINKNENNSGKSGNISRKKIKKVRFLDLFIFKV